MLEDIVISRVRVKMLGLFLSNPGMIFSCSGYSSKSRRRDKRVRRELAHMEKAGMVSKEPGQIDFSMYLKRISFIQ